MKIRILAVGKLKDNYLVEGCLDYLKRLRKFADVTIEEFPDLPTIESPSEVVKETIREKECEKVLNKIKAKDYVVLLDLGGKELTSLDLSSELSKWFTRGGSEIVFVIGGSLGLSEEMKKRGNAVFTLSKLTFTHGFARLLLLEQIYRAFKIIHHEPYNK